MERSDALIKLVAVLVFVAVMAYLGISFFMGFSDPLRTVRAIGMEKHDGLETEGFIVRDEQVIEARGENVAVTVTEGAKLGRGETVAVRYTGSTAMERAQRISEIQLRIRQLTAIKNGKSGDELSDSAILSLARLVAGRDLSDLYGVQQDVDAYIISGSALATGTEAQEISALEEELRALAQNASGDTLRVTAPVSGTFSFSVDGFESVRPDELFDLSPSGYRSLFSGERREGSGVGRIAAGIRWYYVTLIDERSALKLTEGQRVNMTFSRTYSADLSMRIEYVSQPEDGQCCAVFSCDRYLQDVAALREASAEIVFGRLSGVGVPREAVHLNDSGETVVFILEGVRANEVPVNIIAESDDLYMVEATRTGLRVNDQIIVRAANLYDGAVVER